MNNALNVSLIQPRNSNNKYNKYNINKVKQVILGLFSNFLNNNFKNLKILCPHTAPGASNVISWNKATVSTETVYVGQ